MASPSLSSHVKRCDAKPDEGGFDWFGKLRCKRCFGVFEAEQGEVPPHECVGGVFESKSKFPEYNDPVPVLRKTKLRHPVK